MQIIDPHHHLWDLDNNPYPHMKGPESVRIWGPNTKLRHNYLLADFFDDIKNQNVVKSVHVQANYDFADPVGETRWLQAVADAPGSRGFPHGIVGWADFMKSDVERVIADHARHSNFRGIRQIASKHPSEPLLDLAATDYLNDTTWLDNFGLLKKYGLSFDHQITDHQAEDTARLARRHPDVQIILVHMAFPVERHYAGLLRWRENMRKMADCPNVALKLSGLGMTDLHWSVDSIRPLILDGIELFGVDRCMFASNFPVDKVMSDYDTLFNAFKSVVSDFSAADRQKLFHDNAERIYRL
jgi:predicted TIM-barrel fold metal-dependent hydrolase